MGCSWGGFILWATPVSDTFGPQMEEYLQIMHWLIQCRYCKSRYNLYRFALGTSAFYRSTCDTLLVQQNTCSAVKLNKSLRWEWTGFTSVWLMPSWVFAWFCNFKIKTWWTNPFLSTFQYFKLHLTNNIVICKQTIWMSFLCLYFSQQTQTVKTRSLLNL